VSKYSNVKKLACIGLTACTLLSAGTASADLSLQVDGHEIFNFAGNYYTYYGTNDSFAPVAIPLPVGFGIEMQGTSSAILGLGNDPEHYGLVVSGDYGDELLGTTTYNPPFASGVPDAVVADITTGAGFDDHSGTAEWALSYSGNGVDPVPNPYHSVLFGALPDLFSDPSTFTGLTGPGNELYFRDDLGIDGPGGIPDRLDISLILNSDGIYHSVNAENFPATNYEFSLALLSDYLNDLEVNGNGGPGILTLTGSVYEVGFDEDGRNVWKTPEPGTFAIFGLGLVGLGLMRRRQRKVT
jgi:hypothetical protein